MVDIKQDRLASLEWLSADKMQISLASDRVRALDDYLQTEWEIRPAAGKEQWHAELYALDTPEGTNPEVNRYIQLSDARGRAKKPRPKLDAEFYALIATQPMLGMVHSEKRAFIIDTAAYLGALIEQLQISGRVLDVGCHAGYHSAWLAGTYRISAVGIDCSSRAIETANAHAMSHGADCHFEVVDYNSDPPPGQFELIYACDSMPGDSNRSIRRTLEWVADGLVDGGLFVWTVKDVPNSDGLQKAVARYGFCFGIADVVGGYETVWEEYRARRLLVLMKTTGPAIPLNLKDEAENLWPAFADYANTSGVDPAEKTQAFFRAR